jgi:DNA replication ATP-dependent helicase Dna2
MPLPSTYITALKQFVHLEYDTQAQQIREMWSKPVSSRVAEGEAIADVNVVRFGPREAFLTCRENISKFRQADVLRLSRGNPASGGISCTLEVDRGEELVISPGFGASLLGLQSGPGWVLDRDIVDVRSVLLSALDQVSASPILHDYFASLLSGQILPFIDPAKERRSLNQAQRLGLNPSQSAAFARAYASGSYYLIQGPPGTGKTWVLAHLAASLARDGEKVLVTAFTHRAINNALRKIGQATGFRNMIKVGQRHYAEDLDWEGGFIPNFEKVERSPFNNYTPGVIIGGTCFAVRTSRLNSIEFDTVIFDEASQVTLPLAMAGMLSARRFIFIGDHRQMAPVITADHPAEWTARSIFETLFEHAPGTMLDTTYRMCAEINDFPSRQFYQGRLLPSPEAAARRLALTRPPQRWANLLDPAHPQVFAEIPHTGKGMRSPEEANLAAQLALEALACGVSPREIAVVAPYRAQCRLIRKRLRELSPPDRADFEEIVVDTVERIQGQERDLVIVSLTTSDPAHAAQRAAFYFQPNRLNVAITRPRVKRIVIGSPYLFDARPAERKHLEWVDHFRQLYAQSYIVQVPLVSTG